MVRRDKKLAGKQPPVTVWKTHQNSIFEVWAILYTKMLEHLASFPRNWAKVEADIKKVLRRFWGSNLDLFKKVEPHLKIGPSYKKEWV